MTGNCLGRACQLGRVVVLGMCSAITLQNAPVFAQNITLDGTLGPAGSLTGPDYIIPQAVGWRRQSWIFEWNIQQHRTRSSR